MGTYIFTANPKDEMSVREVIHAEKQHEAVEEFKRRLKSQGFLPTEIEEMMVRVSVSQDNAE